MEKSKTYNKTRTAVNGKAKSYPKIYKVIVHIQNNKKTYFAYYDNGCVLDNCMYKTVSKFISEYYKTSVTYVKNDTIRFTDIMYSKTNKANKFYIFDMNTGEKYETNLFNFNYNQGLILNE